MKKITIFTFLLFNIFVYSQSKIETEEWINQKIYQFSFKSDDVSHSFNVKFKDGIMLITDTTTASGITLICNDWIPIKQISSFIFLEHDSTIHLKIFLKNNEKIKSKWSSNNYYSYNDNFYFILDKSFKKNDMFNRMTKALNNLIKLNGGAIKKETF